MLHYLKGRKGEEKAVEYLREQGYELLERNYISPGGEIDIIVKREDLVVFVEVKCWDSLSAENLQYAVNGKKRSRIRRSAEFYLLENRELESCRLRFDLIYLSGRMGKLDHWENAF
ncbi:MAG: YraN family protein [Spirochaetales bacterium]|nr:YraN family protein [Spirochaetales bacterium]